MRTCANLAIGSTMSVVKARVVRSEVVMRPMPAPQSRIRCIFAGEVVVLVVVVVVFVEAEGEG